MENMWKQNGILFKFDVLAKFYKSKNRKFHYILFFPAAIQCIFNKCQIELLNILLMSWSQFLSLPYPGLGHVDPWGSHGLNYNVSRETEFCQLEGLSTI